jgi:hypothetical protein
VLWLAFHLILIAARIFHKHWQYISLECIIFSSGNHHIPSCNTSSLQSLESGLVVLSEGSTVVENRIKSENSSEWPLSQVQNLGVYSP